MGARHRSTSDLPHAPLQMVHPVAIPGAVVIGSDILRELPSAEGVVLFSLFSTVLFWTDSADDHVPDLGAVERGALSHLGEGGCWAAIAVISRQLAGEAPANRDKLAQACFCVADWGLSRNARQTALAFTLLAALILPLRPRYAWAVGRMLRGHGRMREAEFWLRRSHRVAVWTGDAYTQSISLSSLGVLSYIAGSQSRAERRLGQALIVASRHGLRILEGEILHNLMLLEMERREFNRAEKYAMQVVERYLPDHERLPALAHDIACLWMDQGHFARALPVVRSVIPRLRDPVEKFQALAAAVRAAGGAGDHTTFTSAWTEANECLSRIGADSVRAGAFLDLGRGAASMGLWHDAMVAFERAGSISRSRGESDVLFKAESALEAARRREGADPHPRMVPQYHETTADSIARDVIRALQPALSV